MGLLRFWISIFGIWILVFVSLFREEEEEEEVRIQLAAIGLIAILQDLCVFLLDFFDLVGG